MRRPLPSSLVTLALSLVLLAALPGCLDIIEPPDPPGKRQVVIPLTTKVADSETRVALELFDFASGEMRFAADTDLLATLEPGDVLVGEPSEAAPGGYLRKVISISREAGAVALETTQANLTDAVTSGEISASGEFTAEDVLGTAVHLRGVSVTTRGGGDALTPQAGVGDGYRFHVGFDEVVLDFGDGDVNVKVTLNGELYFNAGWSVDVGIEPCLALPPVCVDRFEAQIGIEERLRVSMAGEANAKLTKEIKVASYYFDPIVLFIGPIPVVIVPSIEVFVGAEGEVNLSFSYGLTESVQAKVGARWTDDRGWEDVKGVGILFEGADSLEVRTSMKARAYSRAVTSLMLYGAIGPTLGLLLGAEFDGAIPRDPTLIVRGVAQGYVSLVIDVPLLGTLDEHKSVVFDESVELTRAPNQPPRFSNVRTDAVRVDVGTRVILGPIQGGLQGYFDVMDPEGQPLTLTVDSDLDGRISLTPTFQTVGLRKITIGATDSRGASASIVLSVQVVSPSPILTVSHSGTPLVNVPYAMGASAVDPVGGLMFCSAITWFVNAPDAVTGGGCEARVLFGAEGSRTVRVTATNVHGSSSTETITLSVGPEPENLPPVITSFSIVAAEGPKSFPTGPGDIFYACPTGFWCEVPNGAYLWNGQVREVDDYLNPLTLRALASDDRGAPLTFTWTCTGTTGSAVVTNNGDGSYSCSPVFPGQVTTVRVTVSDGVGQATMERTFKMRLRIN